jgi:hypothetical protein
LRDYLEERLRRALFGLLFVRNGIVVGKAYLGLFYLLSKDLVSDISELLDLLLIGLDPVFIPFNH